MLDPKTAAMADDSGNEEQESDCIDDTGHKQIAKVKDCGIRKMNRRKKLTIPVINVVDTKYEVLRHVAKNMLNWKTCRESYISKGWDVYWTDSAVRTEFLSKLEKYQRVNHFPGMI